MGPGLRRYDYDKRAERRAQPSWRREQGRAFILGLVPALFVLAAITLGPALYLVVTGLTPLDPVHPQSATDFSDPARNYRALLADARFLNSLWVQAQLSMATVALQLAIGLGVALLLNAGSRVLEALRTAFILPMVLPPIVVAVVWKVIFTPDVSPMHRGLATIGLPVHSLIADPTTALWAIAAADTWEWFPFTMLMALAGLQMIPAEPIDAARIDGAGRIALFRFILFPYLRPTLVVAGLFRLIDSIKAFPLIYVLTNGGPGTATEVTNYYAFVESFNFSYWGYGSAIATLMVAGVLLLSWIIGRTGGEAERDE
ncbi:MAG: sugar ABC transporter permease [Alphaproteobacteria bacterium]|nr:sugar ABC transporter permease [Alphaproteobacteria bacterium]